MKIFFLGEDLYKNHILETLNNLNLDVYLVVENISNYDTNIDIVNIDFFKANYINSIVYINNDSNIGALYLEHIDVQSIILFLLGYNKISDKFQKVYLKKNTTVVQIDSIKPFPLDDLQYVIYYILSSNDNKHLINFLNLLHSNMHCIFIDNYQYFIIIKIFLYLIPIAFLSIMHQLSNFYTNILYNDYSHNFKSLIKEFLKSLDKNIEELDGNMLLLNQHLNNIKEDLSFFGVNDYVIGNLNDYFINYLRHVYIFDLQFIDIVNKNDFFPDLIVNIMFNNQDVDKYLLRNFYYQILSYENK